MHVVLVRHAQPEWEREGLSVDDPPLTAVGHAQAQRLGRRFAAERADRLLVSPLQRARQTAEPIAEALGLEPEVHDWLAEIANPVWEGTPIEHVARVFREHRVKPVDDHWAGLEGGESFSGFHDRVTTGLQQLLDASGSSRVRQDPALWSLAAPDQRIVLVAHAGTNAALIGYLLGVPPVPWEWERFVSFHASVSSVEPIAISGSSAFSLVRFADVAHLPPGLQTR
jgi:probable phosphoglycerate mutase